MSKKLIDELDELNFKNNVGSKNSDGFKSADQTPGSADNSNTMREDQFNIKINDLKAELFITNHERDDLKGEVLELKKRLLNLENSVEKTNEDDDNNLL